MNLLEQITAAVNQWQEEMDNCQQAAPRQTLAFAEQEQAALELGKRIAQLALSQQLADLGTGYEASSRSCACGQRQRFQRYSSRTVRTRVGEVRYRRAYYRCGHCQASSFPLDERLAQSERQISAGVERSLSLLAAHLAFVPAAKLLQELTGVSVSGRQLESIAEAVGSAAEARLVEERDAAQQQDWSDQRATRVLPPRTFIVEMDGITLPLQDGHHQEVKCGVLYELSQRVEMQEGRWELLKKAVCAVRGGVGEFRQALWAVVRRAKVRQADRLVVIADGAEWVDQTVDLMFFGATRVLDFYHAAQRLYAVAAGHWGDGKATGKAWAKQQVERLKQGRSKDVITALKRLKISSIEGWKVRQEAVAYLSRRVEQMRYEEYQKAGLPIGSGAIESSCKQIVTARCKQAGMRWSAAGSDAILALRCFVLNDRLDELLPKPQFAIEWKQAA